MPATNNSARASAQVPPAAILAKKSLRRCRHRPDDSLIAELRIDELNRLLRDRYGEVLPDDDAGRDDAFVAFSHYAGTDRAVHFRSWLKVHCPWMGERELECLVGRKPLRWTADALGRRLGLKYADRERLGLRTIGAIDVAKAERDALRKAKHRERSRQHAEAKRRAAGKPTRQEWLAQNALSRTEPWKAEGIDRRTWERRRKRAAGCLRNIEAKREIKQPAARSKRAAKGKRIEPVAGLRPAAPSGSLRSRDLAPRAAAPLIADDCALARAGRAATAQTRRPIPASSLSEIRLTRT